MTKRAICHSSKRRRGPGPGAGRVRVLTYICIAHIHMRIALARAHVGKSRAYTTEKGVVFVKRVCVVCVYGS